MLYENDLAMSNAADVTDGKPIDVCSQSISGLSAIKPLVAFYDFEQSKVTRIALNQVEIKPTFWNNGF
jgi:hypothetical protein